MGMPLQARQPSHTGRRGEAALLLPLKYSSKNPTNTRGEASKALPAAAVLVKSQWEGSMFNRDPTSNPA